MGKAEQFVAKRNHVVFRTKSSFFMARRSILQFTVVDPFNILASGFFHVVLPVSFCRSFNLLSICFLCMFFELLALVMTHRERRDETENKSN